MTSCAFMPKALEERTAVSHSVLNRAKMSLSTSLSVTLLFLSLVSQAERRPAGSQHTEEPTKPAKLSSEEEKNHPPNLAVCKLFAEATQHYDDGKFVESLNTLKELGDDCLCNPDCARAKLRLYFRLFDDLDPSERLQVKTECSRILQDLNFDSETRAWAHYCLMRYYEIVDKNVAAVQEQFTLAESVHERIDAFYFLIYSSGVRRKDWLTAIKTTEFLFESDFFGRPGSPLWTENKANYYMLQFANGNTQQAAEGLAHLFENHPDNFNVATSLILVMSLVGDDARVEEACLRYLEFVNDCRDVRIELASVMAGLGRYTEAIEQIGSLTSAPEGVYMHGLLELRLGRYYEATELLERAHELSPRTPTFAVGLAYCLALTAYDDAQVKRSAHLCDQAMVYLERMKKASTTACGQKIIHADLAILSITRALIALRQGREIEAKREFNSALNMPVSLNQATKSELEIVVAKLENHRNEVTRLFHLPTTKLFPPFYSGFDSLMAVGSEDGQKFVPDSDYMVSDDPAFSRKN